MSLFTVTVEGRAYTVQVIARQGSLLTFEVDGRQYSAAIPARPSSVTSRTSIVPVTGERRARTDAASAHGSAQPEVKAPLPGIISDVKVKAGDTVKTGSTLLVIEAMKMENPIKAPRDCVIKSVEVKKGQDVQHGAVLITLEQP
jgi:biotin carboxyl carrier protein